MAKYSKLVTPSTRDMNLLNNAVTNAVNSAGQTAANLWNGAGQVDVPEMPVASNPVQGSFANNAINAAGNIVGGITNARNTITNAVNSAANTAANIYGKYGSQSSFGSGSAAGSSSSAAPGSYAPDLQQSYRGAQYTTTTPGQFEYAPAPVFNDPYQQALADANSAYYNKISTPFSYQKPADFTDPYRSTADSMLTQITNRQPFSYDYESDPVWQAYKKQYTREGRRASEDTMAQAAAMTGGIPSSYAVTAGAQAGNYYASQLSDKLPELYQMAYNRYLQEYQDKLNALNAVNNQTKLAQGVWEGNTNNAWKGIGQDFDIYTTDIQNAYNNANLQRQLSNDAFNRYQTDLNQYNTNRNFDYGNYLDQINYERDAEQTAYDRAKYLEDTGWKRDWDVDARDYERNVLHPEERADIEYERQLKFAIQMAEMGDTSFLEALGVDPTYYKALLDAQLADQLAQTAARTARGSGSGGSKSKSSSGSGSPIVLDDKRSELTQEEKEAMDAIQNNANTYYYGGVPANEWEFLKNYFTDDELESYGLWEMTEEDQEGIDQSHDTAALMDAINQQYEAQVNRPNTTAKVGTYAAPRTASGEMTKAVPHAVRNGAIPSEVSPSYVNPTYADALKKQAQMTDTGTGGNSIVQAALNTQSSTDPKIYSKTGVIPSQPKSAANTNTNTTPTTTAREIVFRNRDEALNYAVGHGVKKNDAKYYTETDFWKYKNSNADRSLKEYDSYADYLSGYTDYLIETYGK